MKPLGNKDQQRGWNRELWKIFARSIIIFRGILILMYYIFPYNIKEIYKLIVAHILWAQYKCRCFKHRISLENGISKVTGINICLWKRDEWKIKREVLGHGRTHRTIKARGILL